MAAARSPQQIMSAQSSIAGHRPRRLRLGTINRRAEDGLITHLQAAGAAVVFTAGSCRVPRRSVVLLIWHLECAVQWFPREPAPD
jgi:hypothetical protein